MRADKNAEIEAMRTTQSSEVEAVKSQRAADAEAASNVLQQRQAEAEEQRQHMLQECEVLRAQLQDAKSREDNARE